MKYPLNRAIMYCILAVVGANYLAQIPYYLHQYYLPRHAQPPVFGTLLLLATLVWFLLGWTLLARRGSQAGFWLLATFLLAEFAFYFLNMVNQMAHGFAPFFHLSNSDPLLVVVFAIGYLNMIGAAIFLVVLVWRHRTLTADDPSHNVGLKTISTRINVTSTASVMPTTVPRVLSARNSALSGPEAASARIWRLSVGV
jgi:hypothetical protein